MKIIIMNDRAKWCIVQLEERYNHDKKIKKYKSCFCRVPENNLRKMRGVAMVRHAGKKHIEKWHSKDMPF